MPVYLKMHWLRGFGALNDVTIKSIHNNFLFVGSLTTFLSIRSTYHIMIISFFFTDAHNGAKGSPLTVVGLYPNEQKMSVLNFTVRRHHLFSDPVKSKERLIIQCGFRRFECNPIFSDHSNLDKHKVTITKIVSCFVLFLCYIDVNGAPGKYFLVNPCSSRPI